MSGFPAATASAQRAKIRETLEPIVLPLGQEGSAIQPARVSQDRSHQIDLHGLAGDGHDLLPEVDLELLPRWRLESDRGQGLCPLFLTLGRDGALQGPQFDANPAAGQLLLNDDGVPLGDGPEEVVHIPERGVIEPTRRGTFLKTDRGSDEITADGVAGDPQHASNPLTPEPLASQLADSIHDFRVEHPGVLLRGSQVDMCYIRWVRLHVMQVDQIGVGFVHSPSLSVVQEGVSFSVARGVSFSVA